MDYTTIVCGGSAMKHYIPTGSTKPFTLAWAPGTNESSASLYIKYGVSDDYSSFWITSCYEIGYTPYDYSLRLTYEDETYEDVRILSPDDITDCYLSVGDYKSWGYYCNSSTTFNIVCSATHSNSTTYSWINLSGNTVTLDSNTSQNPRIGDIFVKASSTLYILTILQRPNEQSDYFIAPDQNYVSYAGGERTVYIKSRSGKSIKRWWAYLFGAVSAYYYGTGDDLSFSITIPAAESETSVKGILVVEDNNGKIWSDYGNATQIFHQYSTSTPQVIYHSMEEFNPYQSFVACVPEGRWSPFFQNSGNHYEKYYLNTTVSDGYSFLDVSVIPFGCSLEFYEYLASNITYFHSSDFFEVPVRLIETSSAASKVNLPITLNSDDGTVINYYYKTTGVTYSFSTNQLSIPANTLATEENRMICFAYQRLQSVLIPIVQEAYIPSPDPEPELTLTYNSEFTSVKLFNDATNITSVTYNGVTTDISSLTGEYTYDFGTTGTHTITITINPSATIYAGIFKNCTELISVEGDIELSDADSCTEMFAGCTNLQSISGYWDIPKNRYLSYFFYNCTNLTTVEFDCNSKVYYLQNMFYSCTSLQSLNVTEWDWDTTNVLYANYMFSYCTNLTTIGTGSLVFNACKTSFGMFQSCKSITSIDVSGITPSSMDATGMFNGCTSLTSVNLWSESKGLANVEWLFYDCKALVSIDFKDWGDFSGCTSFAVMFRNCNSLTTLIGLDKWNTSSITNMSDMFNYCNSLRDFSDLANWDVSKVTNFGHTFYSCGMSNLDFLANWEPTSITGLQSTFSGCTRLTSIEGLRNWDASGIVYLNSTFSYCYILSSMEPISKWNTSSLTTITELFRQCNALSTIDLSSWDLTHITNQDSNSTKYFAANIGTRVLKLSSIPYLSQYSFYGSNKLKTIYYYGDVAPTTATGTNHTFSGIATYGTLHTYETASGFDQPSWTNLFNDYYWNIQYIAGEEVELNVPVEGGTYSINITNDADWEITSMPDFCTVDVNSGTGNIAFNVTVGTNKTTEIKTGEIHITTRLYSTVAITQEAFEATLRNDSLEFDNGGGSLNLIVDYNLRPNYISTTVYPDDNFRYYDWTIEDTTAYMMFMADEIGGIVNKTSLIDTRLIFDDWEYRLPSAGVYQIGSNYEITYDTLNVPGNGGQVTFTITSDYTLDNYTFVELPIGTPTLTSSLNEIQVVCDIPLNTGSERTITPILSGTGVEPITLGTITQDEMSFIWDFPTDPIYFDDNGGSVDINFTSSEEIENIIISNVPDWLTITRSGNTITCIAAQNTSSQPRTATVSFEAEEYGITKQIVFTQEQVELSITRESYLYVYPADINGYVAKNVPVHITCNIWNPGYTWEISTFKGGYETDCKAVVDHYETSGNVASIYLNLFSLILYFHNAIINVKIKNGNEIVYEEDVNVEWEYVRSNGNVWHQDFGVSTGIVVNTMPKEREIVYVYYEDEGYGRISGEYYNGDYQAIDATWTSGDIDRTGSQSINGYEVVQSKTNNYTGVVRDVEGTYTCKNREYDVTSTVPITVRQVGDENYTCIAEERIPYNKTCISFAYGGYMPYTFNIKADNYVKYIQFEDTQNWECYTAVLYGLEPNLTDQDKEIRIPYDVMNGTTVVESGEMVIIQETALKVSQTEILAPQQGAEYYIEVSAFGDWTIETSGAFFEVEPTSGNGDGGFLIKVYENPYVDVREGVVYVKTADETVEIQITQEGIDPYLYFGKEYIPVRRAGDLVRLMLYSNIRWTTE